MTSLVLPLTFQNCGSRASMILTSVDPTVMGTASVIINDKAQYTRIRDVSLKLLPPRGLSPPLEMYVTNTANCSGGGTWQNYEAQIPWQIAQNNSLAIVYAKFRPALGDRTVESFCAEAGIIHDDVPPEPAMLMRPPPSSTGQQARFTLNAIDGLSGMQAMECAFGGDTYQACTESYIRTVGIGQHRLSLRASDRAGNIAAPMTFTWVVAAARPPSAAFT